MRNEISTFLKCRSISTDAPVRLPLCAGFRIYDSKPRVKDGAWPPKGIQNPANP